MVKFIVIAYALLAMMIVIVAFGRKGREEDNQLKRMKSIGKETVTADYKNVDTSFYERVIKPVVDKMQKVDEGGKKQTKSAKKKESEKKLAMQIRQAGMHTSVSSFQFFKLAFMVITIVVSLGISILTITITDYFYLFFLVGVFVGICGPTLYLSSKVTAHQNAIKAQLPETLDLMSVCMEAGLSFDASLLKISERMSGPLIDEFMTVFRQIQLGKNRNDALKNLSDATQVKELKTFISAVVQSNQLGIPISNVISAQAEQLRNSQKEEMREKVSKVPTKMTIPTVLLVLPTICIVILGPAVFQVIDSLSGM